MIKKFLCLKISLKASFTVEASVIFPIIIFIIAIVIEIAVLQCQEMEALAEDVSLVTKFNPVKVLRAEEWMKELMGGLGRNIK